MKHQQMILITASLALTMACADSPVVAPPDQRSAPRESVTLSTAVTNGTGTFSVDAVQFWDCVNEDIHNVFEASYTYTLVELPNGQTTYRELWLNQIAGTITGLSTGTVWERVVQASPYVHITGPAGSEWFIYKGKFVSETGPTIDVREMGRLVTNANGEVTIDDYAFTCTAK